MTLRCFNLFDGWISGGKRPIECTPLETESSSRPLSELFEESLVSLIASCEKEIKSKGIAKNTTSPEKSTDAKDSTTQELFGDPVKTVELKGVSSSSFQATEATSQQLQENKIEEGAATPSNGSVPDLLTDMPLTNGEVDLITIECEDKENTPPVAICTTALQEGASPVVAEVRASASIHQEEDGPAHLVKANSSEVVISEAATTSNLDNAAGVPPPLKEEKDEVVSSSKAKPDEPFPGIFSDPKGDGLCMGDSLNLEMAFENANCLTNFQLEVDVPGSSCEYFFGKLKARTC